METYSKVDFEFPFRGKGQHKSIKVALIDHLYPLMVRRCFLAAHFNRTLGMKIICNGIQGHEVLGLT